MVVRENPEFTADYFDPDKRAIGNAIRVFFKDGSSTQRVAVDYPIGHRRRRAEGIPKLEAKFNDAIEAHFDADQATAIAKAMASRDALADMTVPEFMQLWSVKA